MKYGLPIKCIIGGFLLSVLLFPPTAGASPVCFPSGETVDLNREQLALIKAYPGVFYVAHSKESIIPDKTTHFAVVSLPEALGGGMLVGQAQHLNEALSSALAMDASARPDDQAQGKPAASQNAAPPQRFRVEFMLTSGYRNDDLDWNIAGNIHGRDPNILSELTWEDLEIFQLKLANETLIHEVVYLRGHISYGWIFDGQNQDSDYLGDNRTYEFSRSNNDADEGEVWDASFGIGRRFTFGLDDFELIPLIGYSHHEQHLTITNGYQTIPSYGSFPGLDSTYETQWYGPWIGLDLKIMAGRPLGRFSDVGFFASFEYHWADYYAEADWNLRPEFAHPKSFEQEADAHGYIFRIGSQFYFNEHWSLSIAYDYCQWETDSGIDRTFLADGTVIGTRLNEVNWTSNMISAGVSFRF